MKITYVSKTNGDLSYRADVLKTWTMQVFSEYQLFSREIIFQNDKNGRSTWQYISVLARRQIGIFCCLCENCRLWMSGTNRRVARRYRIVASVCSCLSMIIRIFWRNCWLIDLKQDTELNTGNAYDIFYRRFLSGLPLGRRYYKHPLLCRPRKTNGKTQISHAHDSTYIQWIMNLEFFNFMTMGFRVINKFLCESASPRPWRNTVAYESTYIYNSWMKFKVIWLEQLT